MQSVNIVPGAKGNATHTHRRK